MRAEAIARRLILAVEGLLLEFAEFRAGSGLSRQAIHQQLESGALFTVDGPKGIGDYPAFFADTKYDQAAVRAIARELKGCQVAANGYFLRAPGCRWMD